MGPGGREKGRCGLMMEKQEVGPQNFYYYKKQIYGLGLCRVKNEFSIFFLFLTMLFYM